MGSNRGLAITLTHGSEKHKLQVVAEEEHDDPKLQDLALMVEKLTGVPIPSQKLIFKGKSLKEMEQTLSALGVQNGCKIMLIGKKNCPEEESELKKLKDLEKSIEQMASKLEDVNKELSGIQKGFLSKNLQAEALGKLEKRIKTTVEQFMKVLEEIDSMVMPENFNDCRMKRKALVKKVQDSIKATGLVIFFLLEDVSLVIRQASSVQNVNGLLAQCDTMEGNISQEIDKLHSKNMALAK